MRTLAPVLAIMLLLTASACTAFDELFWADEAAESVADAKALQVAADQGDADAQHQLGQLYEQGRGVSQSLVDAHLWYSLAAAQGQDGARQARDRAAGALSDEQLAAAQGRAAAWQAQKEREARPSGAILEWPETPDSSDSAPPEEIVVEVQQKLAALEIDPGPIDGIVGPRTTAAVRAYQENAGVEPDGAITRDLVRSLRATAVASKPEPEPDEIADAETGTTDKVEDLRTDADVVVEVQQRLAALEIDPGPIDGIVGPRTTAAVRAYQEEVGIEADGVITADLVTKLRGMTVAAEPEPSSDAAPKLAEDPEKIAELADIAAFVNAVSKKTGQPPASGTCRTLSARTISYFEIPYCDHCDYKIEFHCIDRASPNRIHRKRIGVFGASASKLVKELGAKPMLMAPAEIESAIRYNKIICYTCPVKR